MEAANLKIEKLRDKDNWHQWRFIIRTWLENGENLLEVCEGTLTEPAAVQMNMTQLFKNSRRQTKLLES